MSATPEEFDKFWSGCLKAIAETATTLDGTNIPELSMQTDISVVEKALGSHGDRVRNEAHEFLSVNRKLLGDCDLELAGACFQYERNGSERGFWNSGWPENGEELGEIAQAFGPCGLVKLEDGKFDVLEM